MAHYIDCWWRSEDGLRLHYRDYPGTDPAGQGQGARPPLICLPGLTRNARDFASLAEMLSAPAGQGGVGGWRVLCPEMRGRGLSEYARDAATYTPPHYVRDVLGLLDAAGLTRFAAIGTSLGGLLTMALATIAPERIAGALLNDVGPVLEAEGVAKIGAYVGANPRFAGWDEAVAYQKALFGGAFPDRSEASWAASVRRLMVEDPDGTVRFDYDPAIAEPFKAPGGATLPDLWPGFEALAGKVPGDRPVHRPVLLLRGARSDILSPETFAEMARRLPDAEAVTVPGAGHAPALDEPAAAAAITRWLARVAEQAA